MLSGPPVPRVDDHMADLPGVFIEQEILYMTDGAKRASARDIDSPLRECGNPSGAPAPVSGREAGDSSGYGSEEGGVRSPRAGVR